MMENEGELMFDINDDVHSGCFIKIISSVL